MNTIIFTIIYRCVRKILRLQILTQNQAKSALLLAAYIFVLFQQYKQNKIHNSEPKLNY